MEPKRPTLRYPTKVDRTYAALRNGKPLKIKPLSRMEDLRLRLFFPERRPQ